MSPYPCFFVGTLGMAILAGCEKSPATHVMAIANEGAQQASGDRQTPQDAPPAPPPREAPAPVVVLSPDLVPVADPVLIRFNRPLEQVRQDSSCGVFRADEPRSHQWIEATQVMVEDEGGRSSPWLQIRYQVRGEGSFNGWYLKPKHTDWSRFAEADLVFRLRAPPNSRPVWKIELKAESAVIGSEVVEIDADRSQMIADQGYVDVRLPLPRLAPQAEALENVSEVVFVFEAGRAPAPDGEILLHSIRLSPPRTEDPRDPRALVHSLAESAWMWYVRSRNAVSGMVLDRSPNHELLGPQPTTSSIAAAGSDLSLLPEAERQGWIDHEEAQRQARQTLSFVLDRVPHHRGILPHFLHWETGEPLPRTEFSALDSSIFFNGCCVAAEAYGSDVRALADQLLDRVEWPALIVRHPRTGKRLLAMGWSHDKRLLGPMDVKSTELLMAYVLAAGSRTHPVDPELWYNTETVFGERYGHRLLNPTHGLFTAYYGLGWLDGTAALRDRENVDFAQNARSATLANREFCRQAGMTEATYHASLGGFWGISAGDSPRGYIAPGLIGGDAGRTVWPTAALAAWPWAKAELESDLARWRESRLWEIVRGPYGLAPFNVDDGWVGADLISIDAGSFCLNYLNGGADTVHRLWAGHPVAAAGLERLEIRGTR